MTRDDQPDRWTGLTPVQRGMAVRFHRYLNDCKQPLIFPSDRFFNFLLAEQPVLDAHIRTLEEFTQPLVDCFKVHVLDRGLFQAVEACPSTVADSVRGAVKIKTLCTAGRRLTTISRRTMAEDGYEQITFLCDDRLGGAIGLQSCLGYSNRFERLIIDAGEHFDPLAVRPGQTIVGNTVVGEITVPDGPQP